MIFVECIKADASGQKVGTKLEKQFSNTTEFAYFYACAKMDGWDHINVRTFDPNSDPIATSQNDIILHFAIKV